MIAHPAGVAVPDDLNALLDKSRVPLLINACETDQTVSLLSLSEPVVAIARETDR
jgi:hypothetical protein